MQMRQCREKLVNQSPCLRLGPASQLERLTGSGRRRLRGAVVPGTEGHESSNGHGKRQGSRCRGRGGRPHVTPEIASVAIFKVEPRRFFVNVDTAQIGDDVRVVQPLENRVFTPERFLDLVHVLQTMPAQVVALFEDVLVGRKVSCRPGTGVRRAL